MGLGLNSSAQNEDMDVWQATPSHVDVFSPTFGLIPESLSNYSYSETFVPALPLRDPQISSGDWNLSSFTNSTYHTVYHPLYEVDNFMHEIAKLHPASAQVVSLGHSGLQREMYGLKISQPAKDTVQKFGFVIMGAQHAREVRDFPCMPFSHDHTKRKSAVGGDSHVTLSRTCTGRKRVRDAFVVSPPRRFCASRGDCGSLVCSCSWHLGFLHHPISKSRWL